MNKKLLCAALVSGLSLAQAASAQEFDDRWYLTGSAGINVQDNDRNTDDAPFGAIGLGKFISPNWSLDGEVNYQNTQFENNVNMNWSQYGVSLDLRRHFWLSDRSWHPYILAGLGLQRAEEEYDAFPNPNSPGERKDNNFAAKLGAGIQAKLGRVGIRTELAYRIDFDDNAIGPSYDGSIDDGDDFADLLASVGIVIPLGPEATVAPPPAPPPAADCSTMDDDGDGVNNCNDKCPNSQAGETIGPDGCKVEVTIDLKGVNFDFDKATLRPDSVQILTQASEILKRYPDLRVQVAGHTDQCGKDGYNQQLSERRARTVYDFLTSHGVSASRLSGPVGFGESRPLEDKGQAFPACKSETNRRTELNAQ